MGTYDGCRLSRHSTMLGSTIFLLAAVMAVDAGQTLTVGPRLRLDGLPAQVPEAFGGGEVVLDVAVDATGGVSRIDPVRVTPPYGDAMLRSVASWRFDPASRLGEERPVAVPGRVLVVGTFRPPSIYASPAPGAVPEMRGLPSPQLPVPNTLTLPAYPPNATGDAMVLVEIELTSRAVPREYRVVSPPSGFDAPALEAARLWRFTPPAAPDVPDRLFVYAVLGFRAPVVP